MIRPDVRELECLIAVADHLNFSKAARELSLSQPPLSRHIQALEEKLGTRLFDRNTHSVALTPAGRLFLEDARSILRQLDRATDAIRRARDGEVSRLRLAFVGALLDEKLVSLVQRFRGIHPSCQIEVNDLAPSAQVDALQASELDGAFMGARPTRLSKELTFLIWNKEPLVLALPEKHPLISITKLRWIHLQDQPWVMVSRRAAPAFRQQFADLAARRSLSTSIVQESDRLPAVLTMVAAGRSGITMVPQAVAHLLSSGIVFRKLPFPCPTIEHTFAWRTDKISPALEKFLTLLHRKD